MRYQDIPEDQRALTFPTRFVIKAIGIADYDIHAILLSVLDHHGVQYGADTMSVQDSPAWQIQKCLGVDHGRGAQTARRYL